MRRHADVIAWDGHGRGRAASPPHPLRVFLSHTSDLGRPDEARSFVAAAVWVLWGPATATAGSMVDS